MAYFEAGTVSQGAAVPQGGAPVCETNGTALSDFGGKISQFATHAVIYYEGDPAKRLYELVTGSVMLYKLLPDGRRQVVEVLRPGDIFGLASSDEYDCTAETLTDSEI